MKPTNNNLNNRAGIGLRHPHYAQVLQEKPCVDWWEVHSENLFDTDSIGAKQVLAIREHYPLSLHGVGLSLGSAQALSLEHLSYLKKVIAIYQPKLVSEHLSWSQVSGVHFNDLLPLPYTQESLHNFCDKVKQTQDVLGRQILIENPSTYLEFRQSDIPEWEFYAQLPSLTGCGLLFDVNNIVVNGHNHNFNPEHYLSAINKKDVQEIHLAGTKTNSHPAGDIMIDDHGSLISEQVWALYEKTLLAFGPKPTLIERDTNIPDLSELQGEAKKAQRYLDHFQEVITQI